MSEHAGDAGPGVSRREVMRRGAVLGGTLVWAVPVVQTISTSAAHAQVSPPPPVPFDGPSYVILNVVCGGEEYFVKFEGEGGFENGPGNPPSAGCGFFTAEGQPDDGTGQGMEGVAEGDCITIKTNTCVVMASAVKKGQECVPGPAGTGTLNFCNDLF